MLASVEASPSCADVGTSGFGEAASIQGLRFNGFGFIGFRVNACKCGGLPILCRCWHLSLWRSGLDPGFKV